MCRLSIDCDQHFLKKFITVILWALSSPLRWLTGIDLSQTQLAITYFKYAVAYELIAFFPLHLEDKTKYRFLVTWGCLLSRIVWQVVRIGSLYSKLRCFTDHNRSNGGTIWKLSLTIFKYKNECYKPLERKK